jgi:chromatin segregation and condensation protein Rec8/ScpA/Scc1 (kleisin family)
VEAFRQALQHAGPAGLAHEVEIETITVRDQMIKIMEFISGRESCAFEGLVLEDGVWASRAVIVASFLAILELTRIAALGLYQGVNDWGVPEGPIHLRCLCDADDRTWADRISELM